MTKGDQVIIGQLPNELVSDRLVSVLPPSSAATYGSPTPRIHTQLNDLPSRGFDLIDLAADILPDGLMPWQKFALEHTHKYKPDGRWATPTNCIVVARQNGKSFLQQIRILGGLFLWVRATSNRISS